MHYFTTFLLLITMVIVINGQSSISRSCPEEYREIRRRNDESSSDSDADDADDDQWREDICEQAMSIPAQQRNPIKTRLILRNYCAHYDEALELARENNDTLCETKKREINMKRKRQQLKKKRDDNDDSDDSDDYDDDKRRALRKRELHKRLALRFIRKRLS